MKLSKHIKHCIDLLAKHGDIKLLYTASDSEGNGYTRSTFPPEIRYLSPDDNQYSPEDLMVLDDVELQDIGNDGMPLPHIKKVVLL